MAHGFGAALLAASTPACLITTAPEFKLPDTTPPFLIASGADPDVRTILEVGFTSSESRIDFKVPILSEDGGETVKGSLFLDYGSINGPLPFADVLSSRELVPGSLADGPRIFSVSWEPSASLMDGCHRITLMVSHQFDFSTRCPTDLADSSELTWYVNKCRQGDQTCESVPINTWLDSCPKVEASCPAVAGADGGIMSGGGS